jgi:aspartyl-tRNA(Asn)/glutamyl-tRNA(Gln) amidotransferase subunit C
MHIDIEKLTKLSKLALKDDERAELEASLPKILDYIAKLQEVDTSDVEAKEHLMQVENVYREDVVREDIDAEAERVRAAFPKSKGGALEVPVILE